MKVLIIAQYFPPDMGGGSARAYNVVKGLTSLGHKATVVTAFPHYPTGKIPREFRRKLLSVEKGGRLDIMRTWVPPLASGGVVKRLLLFVSFCVSSLFAIPFVKRVNLVWAANPNIISAYPALVYSLFKRCPMVLNVDDLWPEELYNLGMLNSRILRKIAEGISRIAYATSTAITPISPVYADIIAPKYGIDSEKMHVVPAGVDLDNFKAPASKPEAEGDAYKVLYIGALSLAYDFENILKAALLLSSENRIKFIIQGQGELGEYLKSRIKELDLRNVDVILKVVSRREVAEILSSADALLLPLKSLNYAGISSKLYEYQASGKPIICCSRGPSASYVLQTNSGIVVEPGDYKGLSKSILLLAEDKKFSRALGDAGKKYVENNLSTEKVGARMEKIFTSLLEVKTTEFGQ